MTARLPFPRLLAITVPSVLLLSARGGGTDDAKVGGSVTLSVPVTSRTGHAQG